MEESLPDDVVLSGLNGKPLTEAQVTQLSTFYLAKGIGFMADGNLRVMLEDCRQPKNQNPFLGQTCIVDGRPIKMLAFHGTGVCCEMCRKVRDGQVTAEWAYEHGKIRPKKEWFSD